MSNKSRNASPRRKSDPVSSVPDEGGDAGAAAAKHKTPTGFALFCLTALGVVFGDIGTSPLYTMRQCFQSGHLPPDSANILGVLSLIVWSLIILISIKYLLYVMAADNKGEGGILALLALLNRQAGERFWFTALSVFGAALLFGDGMITPAISVVSAVEGLRIATPNLHHFIIPISIVILILLFAFQKKGTAKVGFVFGPVMLLWFLVIALLGVAAIAQKPAVLAAFNPLYALKFFPHSGWRGFIILGAVFLAVTGGEALYADLGHFSRRSIRSTWFVVVLPALLLNYFGQGALLLAGTGRVDHPFFNLAPAWALLPLVSLATLAAIIASQAIISGVFSLTSQAILMDEFPRVRIQHTSGEDRGQVYVPSLNFLLMIACVGLVIGFPSSDRLAGAYGVAVSTTMVITTVLMCVIARQLWKWNTLIVVAVTGFFLVIDLAFLAANLSKFIDGGWFPLLVGGLLFLLMTTWKRGRTLLIKRLQSTSESLDEILDAIGDKAVRRVPGTSIFLTRRPRGTPPVLIHHVKHAHSLTEQAIILHVVTMDVPHVPAKERVESEKLKHNVYRMRMKFGFMDTPNVPAALKDLRIDNIEIKAGDITYYLARGIVLPRGGPSGMWRWREGVFAFLLRNATHTVEFFGIPPRQVVELGIEIPL